MKVGCLLINFGTGLMRQPYHFFIHPTQSVEEVIRQNGLERRFYRRTFLWQIVIYAR
jgi:hypothetical protein